LPTAKYFPPSGMIRDFLLKHGDHVEAMRLLARIGMKLDVLDDAELLLESVLRLDPSITPRGTTTLRCSCSGISTRSPGKSSSAAEAEPDNRAFVSYASARCGLGQHEKAVQLYRTFWPRSPQAADLHLSMAHALKTLGKQQDAIDSYRHRRRHKARLWRCLLEPGESQDL
jgi:predicted Zn-dependent protease